MKRKIKEAERLLKNFNGLRHYSIRLDAINVEMHYAQKRINRYNSEIDELLHAKEIITNQKTTGLFSLYNLQLEIKSIGKKLEKEELEYKKKQTRLKRVRKLYRHFLPKPAKPPEARK